MGVSHGLLGFFLLNLNFLASCLRCCRPPTSRMFEENRVNLSGRIVCDLSAKNQKKYFVENVRLIIPLPSGNFTCAFMYLKEMKQ